MSENTAAESGIDARLSEIGGRPLAERAAGYASLHEDLSNRLESGLRAYGDGESAA